MKKTKKITELTPEQLAILDAGYPTSEDETRLLLPRFGLLSKDITESSGTGKNKKIEVLQAAGTFFTERDKGETDDDGKKVWTREYLEKDKVDVIILFHRRQLRMYDSSLEKFYSTPIYDTEDQILPLYLDKQVIKRGTQAELQAMWPAQTLKGKPSSKLKEDTILFVLYEGELYQCNLSQSSKWEFKTYKRGINPSSVVTTLGSKEETFGDNTFRKMTFTNKRSINGGEFTEVMDNQRLLKEKVEADKRFFVPELASGSEKAEDDFAALPGKEF